MARYTGPVTRKSRRLGVDLVGGDQSFEKRPYPPGQHGRARIKESEYRQQLQEKQKARFTYGVMEKQFRRYYEEANRLPGKTGDNLLRILESRENSEGVSRVRCSRGWLSLTDASGNPLIEEERESEGVQFPFKVRRPSELLQQCDPWSDAVVSHSAPPLPSAPTCASVPRSATADLARCPCCPHSARC